MLGFVKTLEKPRFNKNNDLIFARKRKQRNFTIFYIVISLTVLNIVLYFLVKTY